VGGDDPALRVTGVVRIIRVFVPAGDLAPEERLAVRISTVDRDAADFKHECFPREEGVHAAAERQEGTPGGGTLLRMDDMTASFP
jgi:hypothetical protein